MNYPPEKKPHSDAAQNSRHFIPVKNINALLDSEHDFRSADEPVCNPEEEIVMFEIIRAPKAGPVKPNVPGQKRSDNHATLEPAVPEPVDFSEKKDKIPAANEEFHFTVELPGKFPAPEHSDLPVIEKHDTYYLEIPSIHYINDIRDEYEAETFADLDLKSATPQSSDAEKITGANVFRTDPSSSAVMRSNVTAAFNSDESGIDQAILKHVTSDPFLSEKKLFYLLKKELPRNFNLSRRVFRKHLRNNGLETGYKRFRAYITG